MGIIRNSADQFIGRLKTNEQIKKMKIRDELVNNCEEFYKVCEKFADIGLNAPKYRVPGTCDVQGFFQYEDIRKAKEIAKKFYLEKKITDVDEYLMAISLFYTLAVEFDDDRCSGGVIRPENADFSYGVFGKYYNFAEVAADVWQNIIEETKQYILQVR